MSKSEMTASKGMLQLAMGIRIASRTIVRELGFMNRHLAGTELTASQVHALLELETAPDIRAAQLKVVLRLDKSATSRLLADLVRRGYISNKPSNGDGREKHLRLTAAGVRQLAVIHERANRQIITALENLSPAERNVILQGLSLYAHALNRRQGRPAAAGRASQPGPDSGRT
jgi:DNA-binding MarR family transcriptional regulator